MFFFPTVYSNYLFDKEISSNTIIVSNSWDLDQARQNVGPDLGPNCLQKLSSDDKIRH